MDLAAAQGFDVRVVALPPGADPADQADGFERRLSTAESYVLYRVRLELDRAPDRQEAFVHAREVLARFEDSPERQQAQRLVAARRGLPRPRSGSRGAAPGRRASVSPKLRGRRPAGARCPPVPRASELRELPPGSADHSTPTRIAAREYLLEPGEATVI
jgi:hypothetical protein